MYIEEYKISRMHHFSLIYSVFIVGQLRYFELEFSYKLVPETTQKMASGHILWNRLVALANSSKSQQSFSKYLNKFAESIEHGIVRIADL